jgi:hypothetical protein
MTFRTSEKKFKQIVYCILLVVFFASQIRSQVSADTCICNDEEDACRTRVATIVAGVTILALVGGVAYFAFGRGSCRRHHSCSSSSCSYYSSSSYRYTNADPVLHSSSSSSSSDSSRHNHRRRHHHHHSSSSDSYLFSHNDTRSWSSSSSSSSLNRLGPQLSEAYLKDGQIPKVGDFVAHNRRAACFCHSKDSMKLGGRFISHPSLSTAQGHFIAFVQLPNGMTEDLGRIPFSGSTSSSLSFGPFDEKGTYAFGIRLEEGASFPTQTKIGSIEVTLNASTVQSAEFLVPSHSPSNYEPLLFYYDLQ